MAQQLLPALGAEIVHPGGKGNFIAHGDGVGPGVGHRLGAVKPNGGEVAEGFSIFARIAASKSMLLPFSAALGRTAPVASSFFRVSGAGALRSAGAGTRRRRYR